MTKNGNNMVLGFNTPFIQVPLTAIFKKKAPTGANKNYPVGTVWIYNVSPNQYTVYIFCGVNMSSPSHPQGIWIQMGTNVPAPTSKAVVEPASREEKGKEESKSSGTEDKSKDTGVRK